jgi:D-alanyl-D-alanine carboxypeptidase
VIGTSVDSPSSEIAHGILGLLSLAAGRPAPQADQWERAGAQGGASDGRARPDVLAEQPGVAVAGAGAEAGDVPVTAAQVAELVVGTYDSLWGRTRLVTLGGRLFFVDESSTDPTATALELAVSGVRADPIDPEIEVVELATWGDSGYGSWAEPILARLERRGAGEMLRCTGLVVTGQLKTPSADFEMPERVIAP